MGALSLSLTLLRKNQNDVFSKNVKNCEEIKQERYLQLLMFLYIDRQRR